MKYPLKIPNLYQIQFFIISNYESKIDISYYSHINYVNLWMHAK